MSKQSKKDVNELADLPHYKKEYDAQLSDMGISSLTDLKEALRDADRSKVIMDELVGVGPKTIEAWKELLAVKTEKKAKKETAIVAAPDMAPAKVDEKAVVVEQPAAEVVEKGGYVAKKKPVLNEETKKLLALRDEMSNDRIAFLRQEWFRFPRLGKKWRRPRGMHSKMRRHVQYRPNVVSIGYRGPAKVRGLHPSGFEEVMVWNPDQLDRVDPKVQAVRVGGSVGFKKRQAIEHKADELGIRVLNRTG